MKNTPYTYIIIGAGLCGLTVAYFLKKQGITDYIILEARDRIGGRIHTVNDIELGATWFHTEHTALIGLLDELHLETFPNYNAGNNIVSYNSMVPPHIFKPSDDYSPGFRIKGGSQQLITTLNDKSNINVKLNTEVQSISNSSSGDIEIHSTKGIFTGKKIIVTLPPRLALKINYAPQLTSTLKETMQSSHTWMSNAIKFGITYSSPFWRTKGFSGTIHGHAGVIREVYDHCNYQETTYALKGFANEALRSYTYDERKQKIVDSLVRFFGEEALHLIAYFEKDWSKDPYTSTAVFDSLYVSPKRNVIPFETSYWKNRLFFTGAETSLINAGYMDGAIRSAIRTIEKITT